MTAFETPASVYPAGPCRAANGPASCRYHGAFLALDEAVKNNDHVAALEAYEQIKASQKEEFTWYEESRAELVARKPTARYFTEDDVRLKLISELLDGIKYQNALLDSEDTPRGEDPYNEGWREALSVIAAYLDKDVQPKASKRRFFPLHDKRRAGIHGRLLHDGARHAERTLAQPVANRVVVQRVAKDGSVETVQVRFKSRKWKDDQEKVKIGVFNISTQTATGYSFANREEFETEMREMGYSDELFTYARTEYDPQDTSAYFREGFEDAISDMLDEAERNRRYARSA